MHEKLRHGRFPEKGLEALGQIAPSIVGRAWILVAAPPFPTQQTSTLGVEGVEATYDVLEGQLGCRLGQPKPASRSPGRSEHPGPAKLVEDLGQVVPGYGERLCDIIDANGCVVRRVGQVEDRSEGILAGARAPTLC